jgi:hypothetical protein
MADFQIGDVFDRAFYILAKKIDNLFAKGAVVKDESSDVTFVVIVHYQIAKTRNLRHSVDEGQDADLASHRANGVVSGSGPNGWPVRDPPMLHQWMVAKLHYPE